eukprot:c16706_g1_i1 orf=89-328(-)
MHCLLEMVVCCMLCDCMHFLLGKTAVVSISPQFYQILWIYMPQILYFATISLNPTQLYAINQIKFACDGDNMCLSKGSV